MPVLSWLVLRGRCRHCDSPISAAYPLTELLGGLLGVLLFRVLYQLPDQREGVLRRAWERVGPHGELLVVDTTAGIDAALGQLSDAAVRERSLRHARLARSGSDHTDYA